MTFADRLLPMASTTSVTYSCSSGSKNVYCCCSSTKPLNRCDNTWNWITAGLNRRNSHITTAVEQANKTSWAHSKQSAQAEPPCIPLCYSPRLGRYLTYMFYFSAYESDFMKIDLCLKRCWRTHFIYYLHHLLLTVSHKPQEPCTVQEIDWDFSSAKDVKEMLLNPAVIHGIYTNYQKCSKSIANLLSTELIELQLLTFQQMRLFQYKSSPQNLAS